MIAADPLRVVAHREHPLAYRNSVSLTDLQPYTLLLREPGSMTRQLTEQALAEAGVAPSRILEIGSRESIRQAVLCNLSISLIPAREAHSHPQLTALELTGNRIMMHDTCTACASASPCS